MKVKIILANRHKYSISVAVGNFCFFNKAILLFGAVIAQFGRQYYENRIAFSE